MLKSYTLMFLLCLTALNAQSSEGLVKPQDVRVTVEKYLVKCFGAAQKHKPEGNQLTSDGLNACYDGAKSLYNQNVERATQAIALSTDLNCKKLYAEIDGKWSSYSEDVLNTASLGDAPLNTDDDLEIALLSHRYEIAYSIANNSGCKN